MLIGPIPPPPPPKKKNAQLNSQPSCLGPVCSPSGVPVPFLPNPIPRAPHNLATTRLGFTCGSLASPPAHLTFLALQSIFGQAFVGRPRRLPLYPLPLSPLLPILQQSLPNNLSPPPPAPPRPLLHEK